MIAKIPTLLHRYFEIITSRALVLLIAFFYIFTINITGLAVRRNVFVVVHGRNAHVFKDFIEKLRKGWRMN